MYFALKNQETFELKTYSSSTTRCAGIFNFKIQPCQKQLLEYSHSRFDRKSFFIFDNYTYTNITTATNLNTFRLARQSSRSQSTRRPLPHECLLLSGPIHSIHIGRPNYIDIFSNSRKYDESFSLYGRQ